jgi:hypothetical protein
MSNRAASVTLAEIGRVARVAKSLGMRMRVTFPPAARREDEPTIVELFEAADSSSQLDASSQDVPLAEAKEWRL